MLCLVLLHHLSFQRKYCNKDCNWEGVPNGTIFKLWGDPYENNKIKIKFRLRERRETYGILVTISILIDILETCCCREYVCLTEVDDYIWYIQWTLKKYWWCPCTRNGHISAGDIDQTFCKSLLFLKSDIVVELLKSNIVAKLLMSDTWFATKLSSSKRHSQSRTASCSLFRVVLTQRQLTLPKTAWKLLFSVHVFLGQSSWVDILQCYISLEYFLLSKSYGYFKQNSKQNLCKF